MIEGTFQHLVHSEYSCSTFKNQLTSHTPHAKAAARALPTAGQGSLEQETSHTYVAISPAHFKAGNQDIAMVKISSLVSPPSEAFKFFHKTSQV